MLPVLLNQLEAALGPLGDGGGSLLTFGFATPWGLYGSFTSSAASASAQPPPAPPAAASAAAAGSAFAAAGAAPAAAFAAAPPPPLHCDLAYLDPASLFALPSADGGAQTSLYAFGVVLAQLLTEQGPLGLLSAVREARAAGTLRNLVPRLPATPDMAAW